METDTITAPNDEQVNAFLKGLEESCDGMPWHDWERVLLIQCLQNAAKRNSQPIMFMYDFHEEFHRLVVANADLDRTRKVGVVFDLLIQLFRQEPTRPANVDPVVPPSNQPCDPDFWKRRFVALVKTLESIKMPGYAAVTLQTCIGESEALPLLVRVREQTPLQLDGATQHLIKQKM